MVMLSEEDEMRIAGAVTQAERTTSGEISCVLTRAVSQYREVPLAFAALAALLLPAFALLLGMTPGSESWPGNFLSGGWGTRPMQDDTLPVLMTYALCQALIFSLVGLFLSLPGPRRLLTPGFLKRHRVRQAAALHFAAAERYLAANRPHVLIFASFEDRRVEIMASPALDHIGEKNLWNEAVNDVIRGMQEKSPGLGFDQAVQRIGAVLAQHFPAQGPDSNLLPDRPLQIEPK
jgi:putative membrane protein